MQPPLQPISAERKGIPSRLGKVLRIIALGLLLFAPFNKVKAQTIYLTDASGNVFLVDLATCTSTLVVPTIGVTWFDLAICSGNPNIVYGLDAGNNIYQIDLTTGLTTLISTSFNTSFIGALNSLVCDGNGNLYAADGSLYQYNIATNTWTFMGSLGGNSSGGDLTFYNGNLYLATSSNTLLEISISPFGVIGVDPMNIFGVYGILTTSTASLCTVGTTTMLAMSGNDVYTVDPTNGNCNILCVGMVPFSSGPIYGAASIFEGTTPPNVSLAVTASDTSICTGETVTLTASGAGSAGSYLWQPGNLSGSSITVTPSSSTTYSVIGSDTSGCTDTAYISVTVNPGIQLTGTSQNVDCFAACNGTATVNVTNGNGPFSYFWTPSGALTSSVSSLCAGNYSCLVTGAGGCTDTQTFTITEPPAITTIANQINDSCFGLCNGSVTLTVSGGSGQTYTYLWTPSGGTTASETGLCAGNYTCTITDSVGCSVNPVVTITEPNLLTVVTGNPLSVCAGSSVILSSNVAGGTGPYTYSWQPGNLSGSAPNVTPATTTVYSLTVTDANNCTASGTQSIVVNPIPVPTFIASDSSGCAPLCVTFTSPTQSGDVCEWDFGDGNTATGNSPQNHCYTVPGTYSVSLTLTDNNGCSATVTENNLISVFSLPFAAFSFSPDYITIFDPSVSFVDESSGADSWLWNFGDAAQSNSILQNPQFAYQDTGCFNVTLTISNLDGCTDDTTQEVCIVSEYVIYVPNSFTPNGDGLNDFFIPFINGHEKESYHLMIFDRWGNLIFESNDVLQGWNGKVQDGKSGKVCQIDTYVWVINVNEWNGVEHRYIGHVNLIH